MDKSYVLGIDFGTDSVRAVVFCANNGEQMASGEQYYRRWMQGEYCDPSINQFRQHPLDYLESLESAVNSALSGIPVQLHRNIKGISVDTTGSTPVAVNRQGTALALLDGFENNPNAMFFLWKDHTAVKEAEDINQLAHSWDGPDYTRFVGGSYSSEWFWAKVLHALRHDSRVRKAAWSWVEHCDWITAELTGNTDPLSLKRSRCAAGHKAMWHEGFGGLPGEEFLVKLDPLLTGLRGKLYSETYTTDRQAGVLSAKWASKFGLEEGISIGVGGIDAHMGAVGAGIRPNTLVKVIGTSSCDMLIAPGADLAETPVKGICGQVEGSIVPGMLGLEAGQSAFGDIYAWFRNLLLWPVENVLFKDESTEGRSKEALLNSLMEQLLPELSRQAEKTPISTSGIVALDWFNGRRTPDADLALKGAITGLTLGSDAPGIFRALIEATAFGAKSIVGRFEEEGVEINSVIALGGVARKSSLVMQILSDVLDMNIKISSAEQACALGAAMCASVAAGLHPTISSAQTSMDGGVEREYHPIPENVEQYQLLYGQYVRLGQWADNN